MSEKTNGTKAEVSESSEKTNDTNKSVSESDKENWRGRAENAERGLAKATETLSKVQERLEQLEEKDRLTAKEKAEKKALESREEDIEFHIETLRRVPENKAFFTYLDRLLEKATKQAREDGAFDALNQGQIDFLEEVAEDEGISIKDLAAEIAAFAVKHETKAKLEKKFLSPYRKAKLAFKDWKKAKEAENSGKEKGKEQENLAEEKGRGVRSETKPTDWKPEMKGTQSEADWMSNIFDRKPEEAPAR